MDKNYLNRVIPKLLKEVEKVQAQSTDDKEEQATLQQYKMLIEQLQKRINHI